MNEDDQIEVYQEQHGGANSEDLKALFHI